MFKIPRRKIRSLLFSKKQFNEKFREPIQVEQLEQRELPATFLVTTVLDAGTGSLRQAILDANGTPGADLISFDIGGGGAQVISPLSALPAITDAVLLDGWSQPSFASAPLIEISGSKAGANVSGLTITGANSTVRGIAINQFSGAGVAISGAGATNNVLSGNYIGTNALGTTAASNGGDGVLVSGGATATRIGTNGDGTNDLAERNVISGNAGRGVQVVDDGTDRTVVAGNYIGTNALGQSAVPNALEGVVVHFGPDDTRIGTNGDGVGDQSERNVISGNSIQGLTIARVGTDRTVVAGNYIGTNALGQSAVPNGANGVWLFGGAVGTRIGTDGNGIGDTDERNVISGNSHTGIWLPDFVGLSSTSRTVIAGNYIGTNASGTAALGNSGVAGILVDAGPDGTRIGTNGDGVGDAAERNLISGNLGHGVWINGTGTTGTVVAGNYIGTNASGTTAVGNGLVGVLVSGGAADTRIGTNGDGVGDTAERNLISGNGAAGVQVTEASGTAIAGNYIGTNATGDTAVANVGDAGVLINGASSDTRIGTNGDGIGDTAERNLISGNSQEGIQIEAAGTDRTIVAGNYIGTNAAGTAAVANRLGGVWVRGGAKNTRIGTNGDGVGDTAERNLISGNISVGIQIDSAGTTNTVVAGNYIGTNVLGTSAVANTTYGVYVLSGATNTRIGTNGDGVGDVAERNLISGNSIYGIYVPNTTGVIIAGNYIGTNASGDTAVANTFGGVSIGGTGNTLGGVGVGVGNLISGNGSGGIYLSGAGHSVQGNFVGTNATGSGALANTGNGINVAGTGQLIGGSSVAARNLISGNAGAGVAVSGAGSSNNVIAGNYIGTNAAGTAALPNTGNAGVLVTDGAVDTRIGTNGDGIGDVAERNLISGNTQEGIQVQGSGTLRTVIAGNYIGTSSTGTSAIANGVVTSGLGYSGILITNGASNTRVGTDGNGSGDAAERNLISGNYFAGVEVTGAATADTVIAGNFIGTTSDGESALGNRFEGIRVTAGPDRTRIGTDGNGSGDAAERNVIAGSTSAGGILIDNLGTDATRVAGNYIGVNAAGTAILRNNGNGVLVRDRAAGTLIGTDLNGVSDDLERNVISGNALGVQVSNGASGTTIRGNYMGTNAAGTAALPNDDDAVFMDGATGVTIGGSSPAARNLASGNNGDGFEYFNSTGVVIEGNYIGTDVTGTAKIGNRFYGIRVPESSGGVIRGNVISGNGTLGIELFGSNTRNTLVVGNYIGANAAGTAALANGGHGVWIRNGAANNTIGGAGTGNLIAGNTGDSVHIQDAGSSGNVILGNSIGTNAAGTAVLTNGGAGVYIGGGAANNTIGRVGAGNLIGGHSYAGVFIQDPGADGNRVLGNAIGTDWTGTGLFSNSFGVILSTTGNQIGGTEPGEGNIISRNSVGVLVYGGAKNSIRGNSIFANYSLGIDLYPGAFGVTANDFQDTDTGPNGLQNFPVLSAQVGATTRVLGTLNSAPNTTFALDFYASSAADPSGYGEGQRFLGSATVTTDSEGNGSFDVTLSVPTGANELVTATATDPNGNTSEFSAVANRPPSVSIGGPYSVTEGQSLALNATATDPDGNALSFQWDVDGDGDFDENVTGASPTLTYAQLIGLGLGDGPLSRDVTVRVSDGTTTTSATTALTVTNVAPRVATISGARSISEGQSVTVSGTFSDPALGVQTETFTGTALWSDGTSTALVISGDTFTTSRSFADDVPGGLTVTVTISDDDGGSGFAVSGTVSVANRAPDAVSDTARVDEDQVAGVIIDVLSNDSDPAGALDPRTVIAVSTPAHGTATLNPNGTISYAPNPNYSGTDSFTYTISDGDGGFDTATVTVTVNPVNDNPTVTGGTYTVAENQPLGTLVGSVFGADVDAGDALIYAITGGNETGAFAIDSNGRITVAKPGALDFEANPVFRLTVTVTDAAGATGSAPVTINLSNVNAVTKFDVQNGASQRSYVRNVSATIESASEASALLASGRVRLVKRDLSGSGTGTLVSPSAYSLSVSGAVLMLDFGTQGLGGNRNSNAGDGYYTLELDLSGDGTFGTARSFYRLFGDANGDRKVDAADGAFVLAAYGQLGPNLEGDVNGDGVVNALDRTYALRANGAALGAGLWIDD